MEQSDTISRLTFIQPAVPVLVSAPPTGPGWLHEIKWDGWRLQIIRDVDGVRIYTRTRTDLTKRLPGIVASLVALDASSFIIDAELIAADFYDIRSAIKRGEVSAIAFDLMHLNGNDLRRRPLFERKEALAGLIISNECLRLAKVYPDGEKLLEATVEHSLEGIVSKRSQSVTDHRCLDWLKVKTAVWREANKHRGEMFKRRA